MDAAVLNALQSHPDMSVAMSGQVGSQVKMIVGNNWLIANVRTMQRPPRAGEIVAHVDFLGEGTKEVSGRVANFRRGVTRYPIPGSPVYPVTTEDLRSVFAASDEPHIEIGTVYPTDDIRGALYVDPCSASISLCWDRPVPVSRPASHSSCIASRRRAPRVTS